VHVLKKVIISVSVMGAVMLGAGGVAYADTGSAPAPPGNSLVSTLTGLLGIVLGDAPAPPDL
jgi:hypothetical protein